MKKRLNDTAAIQGPLASEVRSHSVSFDTRRIENGFVTRETQSKDGEYSSKEYFHETSELPKGRTSLVKDGSDAMCRAKKYLDNERVAEEKITPVKHSQIRSF